MFQIGRFIFHLLYENHPAHLDESTLKVNRYETITQFFLFAVAIYLGYSPPDFFIEIINSAIAILN
jgi:hypothetical protein